MRDHQSRPTFQRARFLRSLNGLPNLIEQILAVIPESGNPRAVDGTQLGFKEPLQHVLVDGARDCTHSADMGKFK